QPIPYDRGGAAPIQIIGVVTPRWPDAPVVVLGSSVGRSFGIVGLLVDSAMQQSRDTKFKALLQSHQYVASERFADYLQTAVAAAGYRVVPIVAQRTGVEFLPDYGTSAGADAWLDCVGLGWGYLAAGIGTSTPYRPAVGMKCRLVR